MRHWRGKGLWLWLMHHLTSLCTWHVRRIAFFPSRVHILHIRAVTAYGAGGAVAPPKFWQKCFLIFKFFNRKNYNMTNLKHDTDTFITLTKEMMTAAMEMTECNNTKCGWLRKTGTNTKNNILHSANYVITKISCLGNFLSDWCILTYYYIFWG